MCGITGFFSYKNRCDTKRYYDAHLKIAHRGPDDEGFVYKNEKNDIELLIGDDTIDDLKDGKFLYEKNPSSLILGHRRLSIIDLTSAGHQPFTFDNLYMVYNGEIYNYLELKTELMSLGYTFDTDTDTEVYLKAYHCWGVDAFNKFNGMWAVAIYDKEKDEILLCRDRFGIKPLYYSLINDNLIFGSEIKFITDFFDKLEANEQMVYEYLRFNYINHTKQTLFKNILQVEPNTYLLFSKKGMQIKNYWDLNNKDIVGENEIKSSLEESIRIRLRSDVCVGSLLSGGIDSSLIVGIIDLKRYRNSFETFSAVFNEDEFSEKKYIDKFKTKNISLIKHFVFPNVAKLVDDIEELIYIQEEPFRSLAIFSQYELYKYIRQESDVVVLLNGQGADEIFTGYTRYYYVYLLELLRKNDLKAFFRELKALKCKDDVSNIKLLKRLSIEFLSHYFRSYDKYNVFKYKFNLNSRKKRYDNILKEELWKSLTFSALREYLRYEDKNSMRFSLESRLPFLDFRVVENAFLLPDELKIKNGLSKAILRKIAKDIVSEDILNRKDKMGFVSPQELWQRSILKNEFDHSFANLKENGLFEFIDSERVYEIYLKYQKREFDDWAFIWRVYCLYKWKYVWGIE